MAAEACNNLIVKSNYDRCSFWFHRTDGEAKEPFITDQSSPLWLVAYVYE